MFRNNLGDAVTLTTHHTLSEKGRAAAKVSNGVVCLSVGLGSPKDLIEGLRSAPYR